MARRRVDMHRLQELVRLHRKGESVRAVAELLAMSPNTERAYRQVFEAAGLLAGDPDEVPTLEELHKALAAHVPSFRSRPEVRSSLEAYRPQIEKMLEKGAGPKAIHDLLRQEEEGFKGSLGAVKRLVKRIKKEKGVRAEEVAIRVETAPGEVAQVDFGYVGRLYDPERGELRRAYVFVMVLGYSRHLFAKVVFDQTNRTWQRLHVEAFDAFGGVVETVVPDNLKAAVVRAAFDVRQSPALNRSYRELARYYGFKVDPCPPYQPAKKGKVESAVKYVKRNFFQPRELADIDEANEKLGRWVMEIAGQRTHGTTGQRPLERFEQERKALRPLPARRYTTVTWKQAKVHRDGHVVYENRLFSVPWPHIGETLWLRAAGESLAIYADDGRRVATHDLKTPGRMVTLESHLPVQRADHRHRSRAYWQKRADECGDEVGRYIREVFDSDQVLSQLRTVQAMVRHLETFPQSRANAACRRASYYGNYTYGGLKRILRKGLDLEPESEDLFPPQPGQPLAYRHARSVCELLSVKEEVCHESN